LRGTNKTTYEQGKIMKKIFALMALLMIAALFIWSVGCGDDDDDDDDNDDVDFDSADFQTTVDNEYFPLTPGTVKTFEGNGGEDDLEVMETVLTETESVAGVVCTVLKEEEWEDGELVEISQDDLFL
jgi:hypothetical protein